MMSLCSSHCYFYKVFVKVIAKAEGMDTIFGHYFEINDEGKTIVFTAHDDTLSSKNAMT